MLDSNIRHPNFDRIQALRNLSDLIIAADSCDPESYGFVQGRGGHIDGVIDAVHVFDGDPARAHGHEA